MPCLHDHRSHTVPSAWRTRLATGSSRVQVGAQGIPSLVNNDGHPTSISAVVLRLFSHVLSLNSEGVTIARPGRDRVVGTGERLSDCRGLLRRAAANYASHRGKILESTGVTLILITYLS